VIDLAGLERIVTFLFEPCRRSLIASHVGGTRPARLRGQKGQQGRRRRRRHCASNGAFSGMLLTNSFLLVSRSLALSQRTGYVTRPRNAEAAPFPRCLKCGQPSSQAFTRCLDNV